MRAQALERALVEAIDSLGLTLPRGTLREIARATHAVLEGDCVREDDSDACARVTGEFMVRAYARDVERLGLPPDSGSRRVAFLLGALIGFWEALHPSHRACSVAGASECMRRVDALLGPSPQWPETFTKEEFARRALRSLGSLWQDDLGYRDRYRGRAPALELAQLYGELLPRPADGAPNTLEVCLDTCLDTLCYARQVASIEPQGAEEAVPVC